MRNPRNGVRAYEYEEWVAQSSESNLESLEWNPEFKDLLDYFTLGDL